jgi:hypothetical protein
MSSTKPVWPDVVVTLREAVLGFVLGGSASERQRLTKIVLPGIMALVDLGIPPGGDVHFAVGRLREEPVGQARPQPRS